MSEAIRKMSRGSDEPSRDKASLPKHVDHNIQTIAALFAGVEQRVGRHQLAIERMTDAFGRPVTTYALAIAMVAWICANLLAPRFGFRSLDPPPFVWLQGAACIAALLITVTILTTQNRIAGLTQQRAQLDLQVNLIAEEKISKLIALIEELRRDLPSVIDRRDSLANAMTEAVDVHAVAVELEATQLDEAVLRRGDSARALIPMPNPDDSSA
jgi:uncharacterized membrane protein